MVYKRIEALQNKINLLVKELGMIETKLDHYAATDRLAFGAHYHNYMKLDKECLELMTDLQVLETEIPPDHTFIVDDQAVS
jgi:hypothetical protein